MAIELTWNHAEHLAECADVVDFIHGRDCVCVLEEDGRRCLISRQLLPVEHADVRIAGVKRLVQFFDNSLVLQPDWIRQSRKQWSPGQWDTYNRSRARNISTQRHQRVALRAARIALIFPVTTAGVVIIIALAIHDILRGKRAHGRPPDPGRRMQPGSEGSQSQGQQHCRSGARRTVDSAATPHENWECSPGADDPSRRQAVSTRGNPGQLDGYASLERSYGPIVNDGEHGCNLGTPSSLSRTVHNLYFILSSDTLETLVEIAAQTLLFAATIYNALLGDAHTRKIRAENGSCLRISVVLLHAGLLVVCYCYDHQPD